MALEGAEYEEQNRDLTSEQRLHEEKLNHGHDERNDSGLDQEWKYEERHHSLQNSVLFTAACKRLETKKKFYYFTTAIVGRTNSLTTTTCENLLQRVLVQVHIH